MNVYLLAALDTKGREAAFLRDELKRHGLLVSVVDVGCLGEPGFRADVSREELFAAAESDLATARQSPDRSQAVMLAARGAEQLIKRQFSQAQLAGVIAIGGSAGTAIGTAAMRTLPLGVPKLMVSTLASGQVRHYVGDKDILMLNSVVDIAGINRITRTVLSSAARAMAGMVTFGEPSSPAATGKPLIAASMFGVTTACVDRARSLLESAGYEVLVFHATGTGGQAMESLIDEGHFSGVLDITTTELADELVGGFLSAGAERLSAAARRGVPQVVSVGAADMVNFHAPETVPERFLHRKFYRHNPTVTLMRTTAEENTRIGHEIGGKVAASRGPAAILLPRHGVSAIDRSGAAFDDPAARAKLFQAIRESAGPVEVIELDYHINDAGFAEAAAQKLMSLIESKRSNATGAMR